jgi:hypothetical protein
MDRHPFLGFASYDSGAGHRRWVKADWQWPSGAVVATAEIRPFANGWNFYWR